jgi:heptosyltransferase-2
MMNNNKKILVVGPSWLGDLVMAQTTLKILKTNGASQIDLLAPKWCLDVARCMPEIDNLIESNLEHGELGIAKRYKLGKKLQKSNYDQAIVLPNSFKSALVPFFAKIPMRTGYIGEMRYGLLNDYRKLDKTNQPLMLQRYAQLALSKNTSFVQAPPKPLLKPISAEDTINKFSLDTREPFIICPGAAGGPAKRWPEEKYKSLATDLIKKGKNIWIMGSIKDKDIADKISNSLPNGSFANLAGKLNLVETVNVISKAKSLITNDSGLMHVASALGVPVIAIYGPTSPSHTPPLGDKSFTVHSNIPCQPCFKKECPLKHHNCMKNIQPQEILDKLEIIA